MVLEQNPTEQKKMQKPWPTIGGKDHVASFFRIAKHHGLSGKHCLADLEHLICLIHTSEEPSQLIDRWKNYRLKIEEQKQQMTKPKDTAKKCAEKKIESEFEEYQKIGSMTKKEVILKGYLSDDIFTKDMLNLFYNVNITGLKHLNCRELPLDVKEHLTHETEEVKNRLKQRLVKLGLKDKPVSTGLCQVIVAVANRDMLSPTLQEKLFGLGQT
ncbi:MAG: hypothetical protein WC408_03245 [Candidatus Micrarchaeia archaeon]|jgi:hypothetical protein